MERIPPQRRAATSTAGKPTVLARKASVAPTVAPSIPALPSSSGRPLEASVRSQMGAQFGHDFSKVRIFSDAGAHESAQAMGARAYTAGSDIVFGEGQFAPHNQDGQRLLAHELTHVVQQAQVGQAGAVQAKLAVSHPGDSSEVEADHVAQQIVSGAPVRVTSEPGPGLARKEDDDGLVSRGFPTSHPGDIDPPQGEEVDVSYPGATFNPLKFLMEKGVGLLAKGLGAGPFMNAPIELGSDRNLPAENSAREAREAREADAKFEAELAEDTQNRRVQEQNENLSTLPNSRQ